MESCEVLIVGGGPAGSSCARRLHEAGIDVAILDKSTFPRDKVCAGWITPAVVKELGIDLDDYRQDRICQDIRGFRTATMDGKESYNDYTHTVSYGIRRIEFDHYLLTHSGARLLLNSAVKDIRRDGDHWIINDTIRTSMLIGAGGHFCPVARYLGAKIGKTERSVNARELEIRMTDEQAAQCQVDGQIPELFFYPDLSGYGWIFRKEDYLNIGVGREDTGKISRVADEFVSFLRQQKKIPEGLEIDFKGHAYLLYDHAHRKMYDDGVLLIGDAAGLAYTQSGEGIRPAIESGLIAADILLDASGDYGRHNLEHYQQRINQRFGRRHPDEQHWLPAQLRQTLAKQIITNRFLSRHILLDRYFLRSAVDTL